MNTPFVEKPSHGTFFYLAAAPSAETVRALIAAIFEELSVQPAELQISTKNDYVRFRKYAPKVVDEAIAKDAHGITLLVGEPTKVQLGACIGLRPHPLERAPLPWPSWLACEAERWPEPQFRAFARAWMRIVARQEKPLSGGAFASRILLDAKNEAACTGDGGTHQHTAGETLFALLLFLDRGKSVAERIRRLYPITLLGPRFVSDANAAKLEAAGARIERVSDSLIVETGNALAPVWSAPYLASTVALRRLAWPISIQNPADAAGLGLPPKFEVPHRPNAPTIEPPQAELEAELKKQTKELDALLKANPPPPPSGEALEVS